MIHFNDKEYTEEEVEQAKLKAPNALRCAYASIAKNLDNFDYGFFRDFEGEFKPSVMEIISVAHHHGIRTSTISEGLADDLATNLRSAEDDMTEDDRVTLALSEPKEEWEDENTPSSDIDSVIINNFEDYLESVYYSPHVQKLLEDNEFKDLLASINIDEVHSDIDSSYEWLEVFR